MYRLNGSYLLYFINLYLLSGRQESSASDSPKTNCIIYPAYYILPWYVNFGLIILDYSGRIFLPVIFLVQYKFYKCIQIYVCMCKTYVSIYVDIGYFTQKGIPKL